MEVFRLACGLPKIRLGRIDQNCRAMASMIFDMAKEEVDLALFPESTLTGASLGPVADQALFCQRAWEEAQALADQTEDLDMAVVFGLPSPEGKRPFIPVMAYRGDLMVIGGGEDSALPFEGRRQTFKALTFMVLSDDQLARLSWDRMPPGLDLLLLPQARAFLPGKPALRKEMARVMTSPGLALAMAPACPGESTSAEVFSSQALIAENGEILAERKEGEEEGYIVADLDPFLIRKTQERTRSSLGLSGQASPLSGASDPVHHRESKRTYAPYPFLPQEPEGLEETLTIQAMGLGQRMEAIGSKDLWIGISGGLDSTLALLVARRTFDRLGLDPKGIHAVSMPAFGSSERTKENARKLGQAFDLDFREIDLEAVLVQHFRDIGLAEGDRSVAFENAQARERTQILFDLSNRHGGLVVGTGDLSEIALGWATYNGDHMSSYGVNASVPKTLARALVRYEAEALRKAGKSDLADLLIDVVETPVSPELLPPEEGQISQKTEEIIGPYELHDFFLYYFIRYGAGPRRILDYADRAFEGYSRREILLCLRRFYDRFFKNQFKRSAMPDGPQAGPISLSLRGGWDMASDFDGHVFIEEVDALLEGEK